MKMRRTGSVVGLAALMMVTVAMAQGPSDQPDKYTWLEDIHGEKPMAWVKAENARTAAVLEKQKPFEELREAALKVLDSPDKLVFLLFRFGMVYILWFVLVFVCGFVC